MKIYRTGTFFICLVEFLSLYALFSTSEIERLAFAVPAVIAILVLVYKGLTKNSSQSKKDTLNVSKGLLPESVILGIFISLVIATVTFFIKSHWHPVLVVGAAVPVFHSVLWLQTNHIRSRSFRLGLSFIELVLATHITPELYIALIVFIYMVMASLAISCLYLEREFSERSERQLFLPLPKGFISQSLTLSFVVFIASLLIFPILPRPKIRGGNAWTGSHQTGYSEKVKLDGWKEFSGTGGGPVVMRVMLPETTRIQETGYWIPKFLLRGRTLDRFNGMQWTHDNRIQKQTPLAVRTPSSRRNQRYEAHRLEIIREAIGSNALPTPYGTRFVETGIGLVRPPIRSHQGTWHLLNSEKKRVRYHAIQAFRPRKMDKPRSAHLHVPDSWYQKKDRWFQLSRRLFKGVKHSSIKIQRVKEHFEKVGFRASTNPGNASLTGLQDSNSFETASLEKTKKYLDSFMFAKRAGHCELFASATALLLRLGGIPSRLVAGFRVSKNPVAGMVNVHQGDAHAWVEAWDENRGWVSLDFTPMIRKTDSNWWDEIQQIQDLAQAYWYKYVLRFDHDEQRSLQKKAIQFIQKSFKRNQSKNHDEKFQQLSIIFLGLAGITLAILLGVLFRKYFWARKKFKVIFKSTRLVPELIRQQKRMHSLLRSIGYREDQLQQALNTINQSAAYQSLKRWTEVEERMRFGPQEPHSPLWTQDLKELDRLWSSHQAEWKKSLHEAVNPYNETAA